MSINIFHFKFIFGRIDTFYENFHKLRNVLLNFVGEFPSNITKERLRAKVYDG